MGTILAGDREFHVIRTGQVLRVTADAVSAGLLRRYPPSGPDAFSGATSISTGTTTIGPFAAPLRVSVECTFGSLTSATGDPDTAGDDSTTPSPASDFLSASQVAAVLALAGGAVGLGDAYFMPDAVGDATDDANLATALATTKKVIVFRSGTYVLSAVQSGLTERTLMGMGRDATTIKLKDGTNVTALLTCAVGATNVQIRNLTYDGNRANQSSGRGALIDLFTNPPDGFVIDGCRIKNTYTSDGIGAIGGTNGQITNNIFQQTGVVGLRLDGCSNVLVQGNYFTDWNPTGQQSAIWLLQGGVTKNVTINANRFVNVRAGAFCIESIPTTANTYHTGITISNNWMDGGGFRGTGISGFFSYSVISGNVLVNGGENAGSSSLWRNGFELWGQHCTVIGNFIENGAITFAKGSGYSANGKFNTISGNCLRIAQSTTTGFYPIQFRDQADFKCINNSIEVALSGSATMTAGIGIGNYGSAGTMTRALIEGNILRLTSGASSNAIRNLSSSSTDVTIRGNIASGFSNGVSNQANSNDVNLHVIGNVLWDNTTPILNTPTGAGYINEQNITTTGLTTLSNGFVRTAVTSAQLAALTSSTANETTLYEVTDGTYDGTVYKYDAATDSLFPVGTSPAYFA